MKTISPQVPTVIDLSLNNPADTATYYVQAVVKDKLSGATLLTQNLTDNGNHYFSGKWTTPQDPTGQGRELLVITTVYTDAGHSVVSNAYGAIYDTWIIQARPQFYGGGGSYIDYDLIKKSFKDSFNELPQAELPEAPDIAPLHTRLANIEAHLSAIEAKPVPTLQDNSAELTRQFGEHQEAVKQTLAAHYANVEALISRILQSHQELSAGVAQMGVNLGDKVDWNSTERTKHLMAVTSLLQRHHEDVLKAVEDSVADFGKQPMEVRMFMPGEIARSKRPAEKAVKPLHRLIS